MTQENTLTLATVIASIEQKFVAMTGKMIPVFPDGTLFREIIKRNLEQAMRVNPNLVNSIENLDTFASAFAEELLEQNI